MIAMMRCLRVAAGARGRCSGRGGGQWPYAAAARRASRILINDCSVIPL